MGRLKQDAENQGAQKPYVARVQISMVKEEDIKEPINVFSQYEAANIPFIRDELRSSDREKFVCLHLTIKHAVISYEIVSIGSLNTAVVHPREVFKGAILANAAAIILYHNHPSGDPEPSGEDAAVTKRIVEAGKTLGIEVLDHIIIGGRGFYSLQEHGLL